MPRTAAAKTTRIAMNACHGQAAGQRAGDPRGEDRADRDAADEPGEAEHADDEALAVPGDREGGRQHDENQVKQVTRHVHNL